MISEAAAADELRRAFGEGAEPAMGVAPGRATLVGEHVDYVGGLIACVAIDRGVAVAVRPSADRRWRVSSNRRVVDRAEPDPDGDIADRVLAPAIVLGGIPPLEIGVAADLPESAGLSSSAAVACAAMVAMLRLTGRTLTTVQAVATALSAERDVVGVPCGELDQRAIIESAERSVLLLDCAQGGRELIPWPWPHLVLVVAASGESHDVAASGYRERRAAAEAVLLELGVGSCQDIGERWRDVGPGLRPFARHIATETRRAGDAPTALRNADAGALGRLINDSHASLRDDYAVSTERLDAMTAAAREVNGCLGARLVGAGFGGSALALCAAEAAEEVAQAMAAQSGRRDAAWTVRPSAGLRVTAADVITE